MNKIKMLVLDIDGTIFKKDYTITNTLKKSLQNLVKKGIKVILCTGRMYAATKSIAEEIGLNTPVVCYQGGLIKNFHKDTTTIYERTMQSDLALEIVKELKKRDIFFNIYINDNLIVEKDCDYIREYVKARNLSYNVIENCEKLNYTGVNKILAIDNDTNLISNLQKEMSEKYKDNLYIVKSTPRFCEFSNINATKGNAVRYLAEMWNINQSEIMACGDNDNDIEMLLAAGIKVSMGNGTEGLKKIADYITDTVDNDGVVKAINKYIGE